MQFQDGLTNMLGKLALSTGSSAGTVGKGPHLSSMWPLLSNKVGLLTT